MNTNEWTSIFWSLIVAQNDRLIKELNAGEQFRLPHLKNHLSYRFDFWTANLGIMLSKHSADSKQKIVESYLIGHNGLNDYFNFINFVTIDSTLYGSITYNCDKISKNVIDEAIENFHFIVKSIIELEA
jgi:hypothetical protein